MPFNLSESEAAGVFEYYSTFGGFSLKDNGDVKIAFNTPASFSANVPYFVKVNSTVSSVDVDGRRVEATIVPQTAEIDNAKFIGNYQVIKGSDLKNCVVLTNSGEIGTLVDNATYWPTMCYVKYNLSSNQAKLGSVVIEVFDEEGSSIDYIESSFKEGLTTGIENAVTESDTVSVKYFNVNGQVSNEPFNGMNVVKKTFADGSVETSKVVF